jgi:hypothetical protein
MRGKTMDENNEIVGRVVAFVGSDPDQPESGDLRMVYWGNYGGNSYTVEEYCPGQEVEWLSMAGAESASLCLDVLNTCMGVKEMERMNDGD